MQSEGNSSLCWCKPASACVYFSDVSVKGVDEVICWINVGAALHSDDVSHECYTADVRASLCKYSRVTRPHKGGNTNCKSF